MTSLQIYDKTTSRFSGRYIIKHDRRWSSRIRKRKPGDLVTDANKSGVGMLIATKGEDCVVLWAIEPNLPGNIFFIPYVPLVVSKGIL